MSKKLSLRIHAVKCVDESGGKYAERFGNDEIFLGGFAVNEKAETTEIAPVEIYPHFDDGDIKKFNPPKVFHNFTMPTNGEWPKVYAVGLILIEKDSGGMVGAVKKITDFARKKIQEELEKEKEKEKKAVGFAEDNGGTATALAVMPLLEVALKAALPSILDFFFKSIISAFNDEIFKPQLATIRIPKADFTWSSATDSAEKTVKFMDHGAIYELTYDWRLV